MAASASVRQPAAMKRDMALGKQQSGQNGSSQVRSKCTSTVGRTQDENLQHIGLQQMAKLFGEPYRALCWFQAQCKCYCTHKVLPRRGGRVSLQPTGFLSDLVEVLLNNPPGCFQTWCELYLLCGDQALAPLTGPDATSVARVLPTRVQQWSSYLHRSCSCISVWRAHLRSTLHNAAQPVTRHIPQPHPAERRKNACRAHNLEDTNKDQDTDKTSADAYSEDKNEDQDSQDRCKGVFGSH